MLCFFPITESESMKRATLDFLHLFFFSHLSERKSVKGFLHVKWLSINRILYAYIFSPFKTILINCVIRHITLVPKSFNGEKSCQARSFIQETKQKHAHKRRDERGKINFTFQKRPIPWLCAKVTAAITIRPDVNSKLIKIHIVKYACCVDVETEREREEEGFPLTDLSCLGGKTSAPSKIITQQRAFDGSRIRFL